LVEALLQGGRLLLDQIIVNRDHLDLAERGGCQLGARCPRGPRRGPRPERASARAPPPTARGQSRARQSASERSSVTQRNSNFGGRFSQFKAGCPRQKCSARLLAMAYDRTHPTIWAELPFLAAGRTA